MLFRSIAAKLQCIDDGLLGRIYVVPGLAITEHDQPPEVMRGEETQIMGALTMADRERESLLYVLPGTHSKWVRVEHGRIAWIRTYMTGELYSVLTKHSILGRLIPEGEAKPIADDEDNAFDRGVNRAHQDPFGLSSLLFSARTLPLFEKLKPESITDYLSGLLIGHEKIGRAHV